MAQMVTDGLVPDYDHRNLGHIFKQPGLNPPNSCGRCKRSI